MGSRYNSLQDHEETTIEEINEGEERINDVHYAETTNQNEKHINGRGTHGKKEIPLSRPEDKGGSGGKVIGTMRKS